MASMRFNLLPSRIPGTSSLHEGRMRRGLVLIFLLTITCNASPQNTSNWPDRSFDPKPWLEDFQQILAEMSSHYANLEWAVENRKMDLPHLRRNTEANLRGAV